MPFPLAPHALTLTAGSWNTVASGLPSTSGGSAVVGAIVRVVRTGTAGEITFGVRRGDSTDTLQSTYGAPAVAWQQEVYIGVDSSQNIGVFLNTITNVTVYVVGGFTAAEAVFLQNAALETATAGSGFVTQTLPSAIYGSDTPLAVFLYPTSTSPAVFRGARQSGSTDTWLFASNAFPLGLLIGLKNNAGVFQFDWDYTAGTTKYRVVGYIKAGLAWDTNAIVVTPATAAAYEDITSGGLVAGAVAALYAVQGTSANESMAIAASASPSPDLYEPANIDHLGFMMGFVDGSQKVYAKLSALTAAVRRLGVFTGGGGTTTPTISAVSASAYLGAATLTGTGLNQGTTTVTIGGVQQTIVVVNSTTITIAALARSDGTNQCGYGTQPVVVTSSTAGSSAPFPIAFGPQAGGQYVTLGVLNPNPAVRANAIPDYVPGDELAGYGMTGTGTFTLNDDGTFSFDPTATGVFLELWNQSVWSAPAFQTFVVLPSGVTAPSIVTQPANETVNVGSTATFNATGAGSATLSWQGYRNGVAIAGAAGTGASASYTTPPTVLATDNGAIFSFVFTNTGGAATTANAVLTVVSVPVIVTQPAPQTVNVGQTATFSATISTSGTWQANRNGVAIAGATGTGFVASYTTPAAAYPANNGDLYTFTFTTVGGATTSNAAVLTVNPPATPAPPTVTIQPANTSVANGAAATFNVQASGPGPLTYQWSRGGAPITGATASSYTTPPTVIATDNGASFTCAITNAYGTVVSNAAILSVILTQIIISQPLVPPGLIGICNEALSMLGEQAIASLTDNTNRARVLNILYPQIRDAELRKHIWNFSILRTNLAALSTPPASGVYNFSYPLPPDCLRILEADIAYQPGADLSDYRSFPRDDDYSLEGNRMILSNLPSPLALRYVSQITDTNQYDPCFRQAFAAMLAWKACERITNSSSKRQLAMQEYKEAISGAIRANAFEVLPTMPADDTWVLARLQ